MGTSRGRTQLPPLLEPKRGEEVFPADSLYPRTWDQLIGQEQAKQQLQAAITAAQAMGKRLDHTLLAAGDPGVGKTSIALLIGAEMGTNFLMVSGQVSADKVTKYLRMLGDGGILFYDEIHRIAEGRDKGQYLLNYMQDGLLYVNGELVAVSPNITIIGATTLAGKLDPAIRQRFKYKPYLAPYSEEEAAAICAGLARQILGRANQPVPTNPEFYLDIAAAATRTPRVMADVLIQVRNIAIERSGANWRAAEDSYDLTEPLRWVGLRADGVTDAAAEYLVTLLTRLNGRAGREAIANAMNEPSGLVEVERLLLGKDLIRPNPSGRGRELTEVGQARAVELLREDPAFV